MTLCGQGSIFRNHFSEIFSERYENIHEIEVLKIRKLASFFGFVLYKKAIQWECFSQIELTEEATTASSRIFIKILFQRLVELMGVQELF